VEEMIVLEIKIKERSSILESGDHKNLSYHLGSSKLTVITCPKSRN
jgi:hypothetical protein